MEMNAPDPVIEGQGIGPIEAAGEHVSTLGRELERRTPESPTRVGRIFARGPRAITEPE